MKKTLLAAALLAGYTGTALAQNSVTLYGRITPAYVFESVKFDDNAAATLGNAALEGTFNQFSPTDGYVTGGNNIGFKGTEDLGNGLKVGFKYEYSAGGQGAGGLGGAREANLTIANNAWGSFELGYGYTASSAILSGISPTGTSYGVMSAQDAFGVFSVSAGNQVKYFSPSISGLTIGLSYSFRGNDATDSGGSIAEGFGTSNQNRFAVAGLRYANGPVVLGAAYSTLMPNQNDTTIDKTVKNWTIGGTYDLKVVKLHAAYGQNIDGVIGYGLDTFDKLITPASQDANLADGVVADIRTNQWMAGLSAPVGSAGKALFSISQLRPGGDLTDRTNSLGGNSFDTMTNFGVAYSYSLSKRTSLSASYGYATNYGMIKGVTVNQIGVGLKHVF